LVNFPWVDEFICIAIHVVFCMKMRPNIYNNSTLKKTTILNFKIKKDKKIFIISVNLCNIIISTELT